MLEEITAAEEVLKELERNQWLFIYEEKEGWYKEESQSISSGLTPIRQELQRFQTQRRKCQQDARVTLQAANIFKRKFGCLENPSTMSWLVASEVPWVEELV
ncbi:unnamed protein product [Pleuronectes platessa]|uniref:Uncharacterized protein n=1 Tax=Pleuronectes platessa TaxID=8262 RepID=A0A9N7TQ58_PLEPL|nr:unnamed protein product [Pleuronectes platessa]